MNYSVEKRITQICAYNLVPHLSPYEKPTCQSDGQVFDGTLCISLTTHTLDIELSEPSNIKQPKTITHHHIFTKDLCTLEKI